MISNVLLVNLLIAMMAETYSQVKENADLEWKYGRVASVLEAIERTHWLPPPFSLPLIAYKFARWAVLTKVCAVINHTDSEVERHIEWANSDEWKIGGRL